MNETILQKILKFVRRNLILTAGVLAGGVVTIAAENVIVGGVIAGIGAAVNYIRNRQNPVA